jgi:hypothetical protein
MVMEHAASTVLSPLPSASVAPLDPVLPSLSPDEVHRNIIRCHHLRNRVERKLLDWLRVLIDEDYSHFLGSPGPVHYVMENLKYGTTEAHEVVQAARALPEIPLSADAFEAGRISWSQLKALAKVAKAETDERWLEFACSHNVRELQEEALDAEATGRKVPRKGTFGLPNRRVNLKFRLSRADRELARKALEKKAFELREKAGGAAEEKRLTPEGVFLSLCREILSTEPADAAGRSERSRAFCDLVIHMCPDCKTNRLHTQEGPVLVSDEYVKGSKG